MARTDSRSRKTNMRQRPVEAMTAAMPHFVNGIRRVS
jgi:hypothetical protein